MPGDDLLTQNFSFKRSLFIEASAGTGKTFSLLTSVIRLIVEEGFSLNQILIVTFTRAAVFELKTRLRKGFEEAYRSFQKGIGLHSWAEKLDEKQRKKGEQALKIALFSMDGANIFTIHGFCHFLLQEHAIEANVDCNLSFERSQSQEMSRLLKDFFRTHPLTSLLHPYQFEKVMRYCHNDFQTLLDKLIQLLSFRATLEERCFNGEIQSRVLAAQVEPAALQECLLQAAPHFKGFCNQKKEIKRESREAIASLVALFEPPFTLAKLNAAIENEEILSHFSKSYAKKGGSIQDPLLEMIQEEILPFLTEATSCQNILMHLAASASRKVQIHIEKEELFFFEDFLQIVAKLSRDPDFAACQQQKYPVVLVDEFQDTDPLQWEIFSTLFANKSRLIVVGDPKQAIYGFRGADIYTYLEAKKSFHQDEIFSLEVNYRSSSPLVVAINRLCASPQFFPLPRHQHFLVYPPVVAAPHAPSSLQSEERAAIHFFISKDNEEKAFFSFIVNESLALIKENIRSESIAILVKDRYQAQRLEQFCKLRGLPITFLRAGSILDSPALSLLIELLEVVESPSDLSSLLHLIGGPLFRKTEADLAEIVNCREKEEEIVKQFYNFNEHLVTKGLLLFFEEVTKEMKLLEREGGSDLYRDLLQLIELGANESKIIESYIPYYESLKKDDPEKEVYKRRQNGSKEIQVMTIHASKGLEFDVVFAIGLMAPYGMKEGFYLEIKGKSREITFENADAHQEIEAEKMRLFYVAATRAKQRLYIPYSNLAERSIIDLFSKKLPSSSFEAWIREHHEFSFSYCDDLTLDFRKTPQEEAQVVTHAPPIPPFTSLWIHSFSSLANLETVTKETEISSSPLKLPRGKEVGILLHKILEKIDFPSLVGAKSGTEVYPLILPFIETSEYLPFGEEIAELCYLACQVELKTEHESFKLQDISFHLLIREMEFLYEIDEPSSFQGMMKGIIDLFFEYRGKYYLLDWKSNTLENYSESALQQKMRLNNYYLQEKIYRNAVRKYLALFDNRPFDEIFGGSFYLFLRGLPTGGVYYVGTR